MKTVILNKPDDFAIEELPTPEPKADEVLFRIFMSGIYVNDVRDFKGENKHNFPRIGGHEFCGAIEKLGAAVDTKKFSVGQKAVSYIIDDCKTCYLCKRDEENICLNMAQSKILQNPDGILGYCGFADFIAVKVEELLLYPNDADFERMTFTEMLACVVNSVNHADIHFGEFRDELQNYDLIRNIILNLGMKPTSRFATLAFHGFEIIRREKENFTRRIWHYPNWQHAKGAD